MAVLRLFAAQQLGRPCAGLPAKCRNTGVCREGLLQFRSSDAAAGWPTVVARRHRHSPARRSVDHRQQRIQRLLGVAIEHPRVFLEEQRVLDAGIARALPAFGHEHLLGLPAFQHRHPGDGAVGVFLRGRVHDVVRPDDDGHVGRGEILVDLVHLQHDVIGHLRLGQQHVHVARQAARDGVDGEAHGLALGAQLAGQFGHRLLRLRHRHAIARDDDDAVGIVQRRGHAFGIDGDLFAGDLHRGAGGAAKAAKDHADERPVHRLAHDVGQDRTGGADQRADHDQQVIRQRKADGRRRPAGIAVQHRHHDRHVRPADPHDQVIADEKAASVIDDQRQRRARVLQIDHQQHQRQIAAAAFSIWPPGSFLALPSTLPASLPKAMTDPVKVTAPMKTPRNISTRRMVISTAGLVRDHRGKARQRCARGLVHAAATRTIRYGR